MADQVVAVVAVELERLLEVQALEARVITVVRLWAQAPLIIVPVVAVEALQQLGRMALLLTVVMVGQELAQTLLAHQLLVQVVEVEAHLEEVLVLVVLEEERQVFTPETLLVLALTLVVVLVVYLVGVRQVTVDPVL
jgi:hypothetical protein